MTDRESIEARVRDFIADYAAWESDCLKTDLIGSHTLPTPCDFLAEPNAVSLMESLQSKLSSPDHGEAAHQKLDALAQKHCTRSNLLSAAGIGYGTPLKHDPSVEMITAVEIKGHCSQVKTIVPGSWHSAFEYDLEKIGAEWRIARINEFHGEDRPAKAPAWPDGNFRTNFSILEDAGLDFSAPFKPGAEALNNEAGARGAITITPIGELPVPSRVLIAADPAYADEAKPLEVRLSRSTLPVELAQVGGWNAFARIWLEPRIEIIAYVPAHSMAETDETAPPLEVGTRCGAFALADAAAWLSMSSHEGELLYRHGRKLPPPVPAAPYARTSASRWGSARFCDRPRWR